MRTLPNIYKHKNAKYLIILPIILLVFGLIMSTHLTFDSTLNGGVSITMQTNSTINPSQLSSELSTSLHEPTPSIQNSPGGIQITFTINQSIANAESSLLTFYSYNQNYSSSELNVTLLSESLKRQPSNKTLQTNLSQNQFVLNQSILGMKAAVISELAYLKPFIGNQQINSSDPTYLNTLAQNSYASASTIYKNNILSELHKLINFNHYSYQQLTPTLGSYFLSQLELVILTAFILISIIVFFIFRSVGPAFAVIFGAANDMIFALGAMAFFGIPLGVASIGGLLMLIGYSIDTDVLTAVRIMKRHEGTAEDRAYASMKTGITMTITAIVSFGVLFAVSIFAYVPTYYEIAGVVLFGLIGDVFTTWFGNASMILYFKKRKEK
ncbi:MAG: hypothetical protein QXD23_02965 [Candidatus Micrarchaeaceae archaeon]